MSAVMVAQPIFAGLDRNGNGRRAVVFYLSREGFTAEVYAVRTFDYSPTVTLATWREYWPTLVTLAPITVPVSEYRALLKRDDQLQNSAVRKCEKCGLSTRADDYYPCECSTGPTLSA